MPFRMESMVAQPLNDSLELCIVRRHHAPFARCNNLVGVEGERARQPEATNPLVRDFGTVRLRCVFNQKKPVSICGFQ